MEKTQWGNNPMKHDQKSQKFSNLTTTVLECFDDTTYLVQSFHISCHFMIDLSFIHNNNQCKYDLFNLHIIDD